MKIGPNWPTLLKVLCIVAVLVTAPYLVSFALEFVLLAEFMGLEALFVFIAAYIKACYGSLAARLAELRRHVAETAILVAELYLFKPKVYISHAAASSLCVVIASSALLACAVWVPAIMMSARLIS